MKDAEPLHDSAVAATSQSKGDESSSLVVEMELGQHNMPKPLLSGYFNSNLNSVQNINEVTKSLDSE